MNPANDGGATNATVNTGKSPAGAEAGKQMTGIDVGEPVERGRSDGASTHFAAIGSSAKNTQGTTESPPAPEESDMEESERAEKTRTKASRRRGENVQERGGGKQGRPKDKQRRGHGNVIDDLFRGIT